MPAITMSNHHRIIANLIKQGTIAETDPAHGLVRVQHGELISEWLPYFVPFAGGVSIHRPPSIGENCIILSPSGETANGLVLCGLVSAQYPQPAQTSDVTVIKYPDGAQTAYNHTNGQLKLSGIKTVHIQANNSLTLDCPQNTITGALTVQGLFTYQAGMAGSNGAGGRTTIEGDFNHQGNFINKGKVSSNGVVLDEHIHPETNGAQTGTPT